MRVLLAVDHRSMPWKNGGGTTTEIAVWPEGATLDGFDWRVSMARVEEGGPFSVFAGVDRTLAVLDGNGIALDIDGRAPVELTEASAPLSFPADARTSARLVAGSITDLNVMTRRGRLRHSVERLVPAGPVEVAGGRRGWTMLFCARGRLAVRGGAGAELGPRDALLATGGERPFAVEPSAPSLLFLVRITPDD